MKTNNKLLDNPIYQAFNIFPSQEAAARRLSELAGHRISQQLVSIWIKQRYVPANKVTMVYKATKRKVPKSLLNPKSHGKGSL